MTDERSSLSQLGGLAARLADAFNAKNVARLADLYGENAVLMPPGEPVVTGRTAIQSWFGEALKTMGQVRMMPTEMRVLEDDAFQVGNFQVRRGKDPAIEGKYVLLLKQADGRWLIQYDIWNLSQAPAPRP